MYKLLALDLDGTLLNPDLTIPAPVIARLKQLIDAGVVVTLATGRMFTSAKIYADLVGISAPLIVYNGAVIRCADDREPLYEAPLPLDLMYAIIDIAEKHNYYLQLYNDEQIIVANRTKDTEIDPDLRNVACNEVGQLSKARLKPSPKLMTVADPSEIDRRKEIFEKALPKKLFLTASAPWLLEIMQNGVCKTASLNRLAQDYNILPQECVVCGNSANDVDMLKWAGAGCAVENATPAAKEAAGYIASKPYSEGVLELINRFFD